MRSAAAQREHAQVRIEDLDPSCTELLVEALGVLARERPIVAERDRVDAEGECLRNRHLDDLEPGLAQPADERGPGDSSTQTAANFGARIASSTSMWMNWLGIISIRTSHPSASIQPELGERPDLPLLAVADHHAPRLDDHDVAALEGGRGDHLVIGMPAS